MPPDSSVAASAELSAPATATSQTASCVHPTALHGKVFGSDVLKLGLGPDHAGDDEYADGDRDQDSEHQAEVIHELGRRASRSRVAPE